MTKSLMAAIVMLVFVPAAANAQERAGDAALGAVSGAIVLGPIGAVAGALVGYTAGPSIARSWGMRDSRSGRHRQRPRVDASRTARPAAQGGMEGNGRIAQNSAAGAPSVQAAPASPRQTVAPPIQGFE